MKDFDSYVVSTSLDYDGGYESIEIETYYVHVDTGERFEYLNKESYAEIYNYRIEPGKEYEIFYIVTDSKNNSCTFSKKYIYNP